MLRITTFLLLSLFSLSVFAQNENCSKFSNRLSDYNNILPTEKVYIHTDQNYYEPGAQIWFKAYLTDAALEATKTSGQLLVELNDGIGNKVSSLLLEVKDGDANGDFYLTNEAIGGIYTLRAYTGWHKNFDDKPVFEKKLTVQRYMLPNLLMTLDFMRERYGPGAEVSAKFKVRTKDDKPLSNKKFEFSVELAGKKHTTGQLKTDAQGLAIINFRLPEDLKTADGLLNISIEQDGRTESISRSVPIMTQKLVLQFMPEGGDLVDGFKNRVAFKALDEFGKPVDLKGRVINQNGQELAVFGSYHQGLGSFFLSPKKGESYKVEILEPKGISTVYTLPKSLQSAVTLRLDEQNKDNIRIIVFSPKNQPLCLAVQMQDKIVYDLGIDAKSGENIIDIPTGSFPLGIAQITIFDAAQIPQAERLAFVNKHRELTINISTHKPFYQIRDSVFVDISVTDETGKGVQGDFSMAVVDDKLWTFADDKQDNILSYLLMSSDLKGNVYEPNFYFDPKEQKADTALDYVMLTHGWRRYEWRQLMAKNAETYYKRQRKFEPDPATALSGRLLSGGYPLANTTIYIKSAKPDNCFKGPFSIITDSDGGFYIPNFDQNCPLRLTAYYRGMTLKQDVYSQNYNYYVTPERKRNKGVEFQRQPFKPEVSNPKSTYAQKLAQGKEALQGFVRDANNVESLVFATVTLSQNGVVIAGVVTDFDGKYEFNNLAAGDYKLTVKYLGYKTSETNINIIADKILIHDIHLGAEQLTLSEVVITSRQMEREVMSLTSASFSRAISNDTYIDGVRVKGRVEMPRQERKKEEFKVTAIDDKISGGRIIRADEIRQLPTRNISAIQSITAGIQRTNTVVSNENSNQAEMSKLRGELPFGYSNDRALNNVTRGEGPIVQANFSITQAGKPAFFTAKTFYVPDYTEYLTAQRKGIAGVVTRSDFRKTIYWQPFLQTDSTGKARVLLFNSDATTTFRIIVEGIGKGGKAARKEHTYSVQMPFEIDVKMPRILTFGDTVLLPLVLKNNRTEELLGQLSLSKGSGLMFLDTFPTTYQIPGKGFIKIELPFLVMPGQSKQRLIARFESMGISDEVNVEYETRSKGFPMELTISGNEISKAGTFSIDQLVNGSLKVKLEVFSDILQDMKSSMEGMLREPYGCFEQVSSSNYPNILALQYMKTTNSLDPAVYDRAYGFLDNGYKKLAGYECAGGGFEWFGKSPAHEGLTAFGLMEFKDMAAVYSGVDASMVDRAKSWLLSRRDGTGGFQAGTGYNHGWGNSKAVSDAYITYALAYIGEKNISSEIAKMTTEAENSKDLYRLGLAVLTNFHFGQTKKAESLLLVLNQLIDKVGAEQVTGEHSITYSTGAGLRTEILGIAITANLKSAKPDEIRLRKFVEVILKSRSYGHFGCTQSTVWALKSLADYAAHVGKSKVAEGRLVLYVNGTRAVNEAVSTSMTKKLLFEDFGQYLKEGKNDLELKFEGMPEAIPYSLRLEWATLTPQSAKECPLNIETKLASTYVKIGDNVRLTTVIKNSSAKDAPSAMAMIGIPAGLSLQPWQLKEMLETQKADFYEIIDNYLVLYYRSIRAGESKTVELDLKAEVPGNYRAAASRSYMYYTAEYKDWEEGESIRVIN